MDDTSYGIQGRLAQLNAVLRKSDAALYDHLQGQGVDTSFFGMQHSPLVALSIWCQLSLLVALRWITTLFSREFDLPDTMYSCTLLSLYCPIALPSFIVKEAVGQPFLRHANAGLRVIHLRHHGNDTSLNPELYLLLSLTFSGS